MTSTSTDVRIKCENCLEYVKIYLACFKCGAAYHIYCWKRVPGAYVNEGGQLFCCSNITSNYATTNTNLGNQDDSPEKVIEKGNVNGYNEDLKNCPIKQEDFEWNEFKCDAWHLELTNKDHLENQYSECTNQEGEFIQELKEEKEVENCLHKEEALEWSEFRCGACLLEFANEEQLINHYSECPNKEEGFIQELKEDKAGLSCPFCNEGHFQKESYEQHIKRCDLGSSYSQLNKDNSIHSNERSFKCDYTGNKSEVVKSHFTSKHYNKNEHYDSSICTFSTSSEDAVRGQQRIYSSERLFKCDWCDYTAAQETNLKIHIKSKHSNADKKYKCGDCEYSFNTKVNLLTHIRTHTGEKPFKCDMCDYAAARKDRLKLHVLVKHSNADKEYKCGDCNYSTHTKTALVRHIHTHTNEKVFKCNLCDYAAAQKKYLKSHVLVKHTKADKKKEYKCKDCEYSTYRKDYLVCHLRTHTNERPFKCDMCDYAAVRKEGLTKHVLVKHSNVDKKYKCRDCEYCTYRKDYLVCHTYTHTNERRFKCDMCDYAAALRQALKRHVLAKHSNADKEYKCRDCGYSSHTKGNLVTHIRTHTNEKPFKCDICDYAAGKKSCLDVHILAKHSNADK